MPSTTIILFSCFFLSGFCALFYELTWQRLFLRLVGSTTLANTLTLCLFMAGLSLGAIAYSWISSRNFKKFPSDLKIFAFLELTIGAFGFLSMVLCRNETLLYLFDLLRSFTGALPTQTKSIILFSLVFGALALPTVSMGATLPVIAGHFEKYHSAPALSAVASF